MYKSTLPTVSFLFDVIDDWKLDHGRPPDKIYLNATQHERLNSELYSGRKKYIPGIPIKLGDVSIYRSLILNIGYECL